MWLLTTFSWSLLNMLADTAQHVFDTRVQIGGNLTPRSPYQAGGGTCLQDQCQTPRWRKAIDHAIHGSTTFTSLTLFAVVGYLRTSYSILKDCYICKPNNSLSHVISSISRGKDNLNNGIICVSLIFKCLDYLLYRGIPWEHA